MDKDKILGLIWLVVTITLLYSYTVWVWGGYIAEQVALSPCTSEDPSFWCPFSWMIQLNLLGWPWELAIIVVIYVVICVVLLVLAWIGLEMARKKKNATFLEDLGPDRDDV
ncbi:MAG: hypothetical protein ACTSWN_04300 [Promethearchaeota archaeon]